MRYANELKLDAAKSLSDKIEKATRFNLYSHDLDSENYQVMNYGIGGTISGHVDSAGTHIVLKLLAAVGGRVVSMVSL